MENTEEVGGSVVGAYNLQHTVEQRQATAVPEFSKVPENKTFLTVFEPDTEMTIKSDKTCCTANLNYLPIKAHYFFFYGGMAATVTFMQVIAKNLGFSATAVGFIYTVVPFCTFLAKPLFGYVTDLFRNVKNVIITLVIITTLAFLAVLLVPPIYNHSDGYFSVKAVCTNQSDQVILIPLAYQPCMQIMDNRHFKCDLLSKCVSLRIAGTLDVTAGSMNNMTFLFTLSTETLSIDICDCLKSNISDLSCDSLECNTESGSGFKTEYKTYNFWQFSFLAIIAETGATVLFCLSDAACYEVLDGNPNLYGSQRLWASIGWGISSLFAGYLNDLFTGNSDDTNYSPCFYLMLAFVIVDLMVLIRLRLIKANISTSICKDIGKIYKSHLTVLLSFGVYIAGTLTGLIWNYQLWFLIDLGASQTLLGIVVAFQCLVAEAPFFFFSKWFIVTFGHFYCLIVSLAAFALRIGLYSLLTDPWLTLPIELLDGVTFAISYTAMTSYAADYAPPGTEATMLGVLGGLFEGLGVATGSLLGGLGFDKLGSHQTFFLCSMISVTSALLLLIAYNIIIRTEAKPETSKTPETTIANCGSNSSDHK